MEHVEIAPVVCRAYPKAIEGKNRTCGAVGGDHYKSIVGMEVRMGACGRINPANKSGVPLYICTTFLSINTYSYQRQSGQPVYV